MPKVCHISGIVLRNDEGQFSLVQEGKPSAYGMWNLPAGHVEPGETLFDTAIREAREETGYKVRIVSETPIVDFYDTKIERHFHIYHAEIVGGELVADGIEILSARWMSFKDVQDLHDAGNLRAPFVFDAIQRCNIQESA